MPYLFAMEGCCGLRGSEKGREEERSEGCVKRGRGGARRNLHLERVLVFL